MLIIVEPTALPTDVAGRPKNAAMKDTLTSGDVVARLTTVAPIKIFGTPVASAIPTAPSVNHSAPLRTTAKPARNVSKFSHSGRF